MAHVALRLSSSSAGRVCLQTQSRAGVWYSIIQLVVKELTWWVKAGATEIGSL